MNFDIRLFPRKRVPYHASRELNECGISCLSMIIGYYEGSTDLAQLRQMTGDNHRGESMLALRDMATEVGLRARGMKVPLAQLSTIKLPAIIHWEMDHFVVLESATAKGAWIVDPVVGRCFIDQRQMGLSFTGIALEVEPAEGWERRKRAAKPIPILQVIKPLARNKAQLVAVVILSLLLELTTILAPLQLQISVDQALFIGDRKLVTILALGFAALVIVQACISVVRAWSSTLLSFTLNQELMSRFVESIHAKPASFFMKFHTGDMLSRARSVHAIQHSMTSGLIQVSLDALMSALMLAFLYFASPLLALIIASMAALNALATGLLKQAAIESGRRTLRLESRSDATFLENTMAARAIKIFGKAGVRISVWRNRFVELLNSKLVAERLKLYSEQSSRFIASASNVLLIAVGASMVMDLELTLGTLMMIFMLRGFLVERLNNCVKYAMELNEVRTHIERLSDVIDFDEPAPDANAPQATGRDAPAPLRVDPQGKGLTIEFQDVWFRYSAKAPWILRGASFRIEAGESVAITGPSGAGKSTIISLILRLVAPERGEILINGQSLAGLDQKSMARNFGVVMQDDRLFQGSIAENLAFFDAPIDQERVIQVARMAQIEADILHMPMGYQTPLTEAAMDISGGQKQRLFIARALYHRPQCLLLDEATSHLDTFNESEVSKAIQAIEVTRLLVAHRQETISSAERALLLDPRTGQITELARPSTSVDQATSQGASAPNEKPTP